MPEMTFIVRWPDGSVDECYSPSLVMHDHLQVGANYTVADFATRSVDALSIASDRVRARFGYFCSSASDSAAQIQRTSAAFAPIDTVEVLAMHPPPASQETS